MSQHDHTPHPVNHSDHAAATATAHDHAAMGHTGHDDAQAPTAGHSGHGHADHGGHAGHGDHVARFRRLFWIMLILAVPVVGFSGMFSMIIGYPLPDAAWVGWTGNHRTSLESGFQIAGSRLHGLFRSALGRNQRTDRENR